MVKHEIMIIADYTQETSLTLDELCEICNIPARVVHDYIAYDIIHPAQSVQHEWLFGLTELQRIKAALRLQRDLELNLAGVALVLDLLDEVEKLRAHTALLERHISQR